MWTTLQQYPLLVIGPALGAAWIGWRLWDKFPSLNVRPRGTGMTAAWQTLATSYPKNATLAEIRSDLMEAAIPWPSDDEG